MKTTIVLGFDFGTQQIGVAVGQSITNSARPLTVIRANQGVPDWLKIDELIQQWHPDTLIVGIPIDMYDKVTPSTQAALHFAEQLTERYHLPVHQVDEKLTTREAKIRLISQKKPLDKANIDAVAAQLIVELWLN